jgi:uncharacterized membrane protein HdeD (DUF308 family)
MLLVDQLARYWWLVALRGLAAPILGVLTLTWPGMSLGVLILVCGIYALADGSWRSWPPFAAMPVIGSRSP